MTSVGFFFCGNSISPPVHREQEATQTSHAIARSIALIAAGLILAGITIGFGATGLAHGTMLLNRAVILITVGSFAGIVLITAGSEKLYRMQCIARTQRVVPPLTRKPALLPSGATGITTLKSLQESALRDGEAYLIDFSKVTSSNIEDIFNTSGYMKCEKGHAYIRKSSDMSCNYDLWISSIDGGASSFPFDIDEKGIVFFGGRTSDYFKDYLPDDNLEKFFYRWYSHDVPTELKKNASTQRIALEYLTFTASDGTLIRSKKKESE